MPDDWYSRRVATEHRIAQREGYANVLRRHIAQLDRLMELRACFYLMGAHADAAWRDDPIAPTRTPQHRTHSNARAQTSA